jgi:hypothetical protein
MANRRFLQILSFRYFSHRGNTSALHQCAEIRGVDHVPDQNLEIHAILASQSRGSHLYSAHVVLESDACQHTSLSLWGSLFFGAVAVRLQSSLSPELVLESRGVATRSWSPSLRLRNLLWRSVRLTSPLPSVACAESQRRVARSSSPPFWSSGWQIASLAVTPASSIFMPGSIV